MTDEAGTDYVAVVRRGEGLVFRTLQDYFGGQDQVLVIWDRRTGERRRARGPIGNERRRAERRTPPSPSWEEQGFLITPQRRGG